MRERGAGGVGVCNSTRTMFVGGATSPKLPNAQTRSRRKPDGETGIAGLRGGAWTRARNEREAPRNALDGASARK